MKLFFVAIATLVLECLQSFNLRHHQHLSMFPLKYNQNIIIYKLNHKRLHGRVAKVEDEESKADQLDNEVDGEIVEIPFGGLIGMKNRNLFDTPLEVYDPTEELMNVPGEDGSEEQALNMQRKIQERVDRLKASGEWQKRDAEFSKDPLSNIPMWSAAYSMVKSAKPFERWDEFALTYILVVVGGTLLGLYIYLCGVVLDIFFDWFLKTDFDSDYFNSLSPLS